jgi:two-component system phosphate regulon response regulator PhoB
VHHDRRGRYRARLALSHNLETEGYVIESVDRGDEAVRKLTDAPPDLVILDWMLPGISGPEICIRLRAEEATRMLPIIMLSARGEEFLRLRGFSAGRMISSSSPSRCAS